MRLRKVTMELLMNAEAPRAARLRSLYSKLISSTAFCEVPYQRKFFAAGKSHMERKYGMRASYSLCSNLLQKQLLMEPAACVWSVFASQEEVPVPG